MVGAGLRALLFATVMLALPAAASAGQARIAYTSGDDIALMGGDGAGRTTLVHVPGRQAGTAAWAPDGSRIVFAAFDGYSELLDQPSVRPSLYTVRPDGTGLTPLTLSDGRSWDYSPRYSPDGRRIAFARMTIGRNRLVSSILTMSAGGGDERTLATMTSDGLEYVDDPAWSRDGARIVYTRAVTDRAGHQRPALWTVPASGGTGTLLLRDASSAEYSPDGARIAYVSVADHAGADCAEGCGFDGAIYTMAADGGDQHRMTPKGADYRGPSWSPDGTRITVASNRNDPSEASYEIYSVHADGSCMTWLTNESQATYDPQWEQGAGPPAEPPGCGGVQRPPFVNPALTAGLRVPGADVYWLGPVAPGGLALSKAGPDDQPRFLSLEYDDCRAYDRRACSRVTPQLRLFPACRAAANELYGFDPRGLSRQHGALVYRGHDSAGGAIVFTGRTAIELSVHDPGRIRRLVAALRPLGAAAPPPKLPPAGLPRRVWRKLDRAGNRARAMRRKLIRLGVKRLGC